MSTSVYSIAPRAPPNVTTPPRGPAPWLAIVTPLNVAWMAVPTAALGLSNSARNLYATGISKRIISLEYGPVDDNVRCAGERNPTSGTVREVTITRVGIQKIIEITADRAANNPDRRGYGVATEILAEIVEGQPIAATLQDLTPHQAALDTISHDIDVGQFECLSARMQPIPSMNRAPPPSFPPATLGSSGRPIVF